MVWKLFALIFIFFLLFLVILSVIAQPECKVLNPSLYGTYIGKCKKGYANGWGIALGIDRYTGHFKNGLPHGEGTYEWQTGEIYTGKWKNGLRHGTGRFAFKYHESDSVLYGIWENDRFIGPAPDPPTIISKQNIAKADFQRIGEGTRVTISFAGVYQRDIYDLTIFGDSGTEFSSGIEAGYDYIEFPFHCKIVFRTSDSSHLTMRYCILEFIIKQPGNWIVKIFN